VIDIIHHPVSTSTTTFEKRPMKILIMGLPGSGKTYLTERLVPIIGAAWFNADKIREMANDWDFSHQGRIRQSDRMKTFANFESSHGRLVVCDFVCPTKKTRQMFGADFTVWMDTIKEGRFEDTNQLFERPRNVNMRITAWNENNHHDVAQEILRVRG
jgi:adenylylsulfate kinase